MGMHVTCNCIYYSKFVQIFASPSGGCCFWCMSPYDRCRSRHASLLQSGQELEPLELPIRMQSQCCKLRRRTISFSPVCMTDLHLWPSSLGNTTKESVNQHVTSCLIHSNLRESSQCSSTSSYTFFLKTKHARHSEPTLRHFQVVALKRTVSIPDLLQSPRGLTAQEGHDDLKSIMGTCATQA